MLGFLGWVWLCVEFVVEEIVVEEMEVYEESDEELLVRGAECEDSEVQEQE